MEPNTEMSETQQPSPPLLDEQLLNNNEEKEETERVKIQAEEQIIQSCEQDPGTINADEEEVVEQFEDPVRVQVEIKPEIGEEGPQLEEKRKEKQQKEETDIVNTEQQHEDDDMEGPPPGWDSLPPPSPPPPPPQLSPSPKPEMGQMVCGSCRHLLSYPHSSKHVRCSCCLTVNYVLEEHQVGQVKCEICAVLLMYPFGAQSVRCCSSCSVINIGDHNRRPSLSVQQSRACRPFSIGH